MSAQQLLDLGSGMRGWATKLLGLAKSPSCPAQEEAEWRLHYKKFLLHQTQGAGRCISFINCCIKGGFEDVKLRPEAAANLLLLPSR